ncbi:MAG: T9SS type A sorting domain-containing protein [Bacteroidales bacterium]|nr:T9SS type A sorting domain-containing protein [Bacteroidales bacterium]
MDKRFTFSWLVLISVAFLLSVNSTLLAQSQQFHTDTVYHQEFGCDSFLLTANHTYFHNDTVVKIPHYVADQGIVYMDVLDVYQIVIGHSYTYKDTVTARVCRNNLPYAYHGNFYTQTGNYWVHIPTLQGCDSLSTLVKLVVLEGQKDTTFASMCNAEPVVVNGITFTNPGTFNFPQGVDEDGCPVVQTYVITPYTVGTDTVDIMVCENELPYTYMGYSLPTQNNYRVPYVSEGGCNAIKYVRLRTCPIYEIYDTVDVTVCEIDMPYEYGGETFNESGTYQIPVPNQCGCDSAFVTLNLQVTQPQTETVTLTLCEGDFPYSYDSLHVFSEPGAYYINEDADSTCTHFTYLVLNAYHPLYDTINICTPDSFYTYRDTTFTSSTIYTYCDTNAYNCVDYLTLKINLNSQLVYDTVNVTICESEKPFVFEESEYWFPGIYDVMIQNQQGCDSAAVRFQLEMIPNATVSRDTVITRNDLPFVYYDSVFTKSGLYWIQIPAAPEDGCDTILYFNLTIQQQYFQLIDTTVCEGTVVEYLGEEISTAGPHEFIYHFAGYDSIITLNVHHLPRYVDETVYVELGEYDLPYLFADSAYFEAGYHERVLQTVSGCDSLVSLYLTVIPAIINNDTLYREVCSNDMPVTLYDSLLTEPGVYRYLIHTEESSIDSVFYVRLNVKESPTLIIADTSYLCAESTATLTAQSTGSLYVWSNGEQVPSITVSLPGVYGVTVTNAFECSASASVQVIPVELPDALVIGDNEVCYGNNLMLQAIGGTDFLWDDGSTTNVITVSPTENVTYTVTVSNVYGCSVVKEHTVTVNPLPQLVIQGNNSICSGSSTTFHVSGAMSYTWNNGSHANQITANTSGTYSVTGTDPKGCRNSSSATLTVHPLPVIQINGRNSFCQGGNTTITATGASTYVWSSGEVTQSVVADHAEQYTVTGTDQYGCTATSSVIISQSTVNASISGNTYLCHGQGTTLTVMGDDGNTYRWFDGSTNNTININAAGTYSVTVTNTNGCQNTLSAMVNEYNTTVPTISGNLTICENQTTTLRASGGSTYLWDDGSTGPMITVGATGTYSVTATGAYGCTATTSATVLVNPIPTVNILSLGTICKDDEVTLTAISNAGTFNWNSGQNTAAITVSPTVNSTYTVLVTDENGCSNTASTQITVNPLPQLYVSGQTSFCQGDTAQLNATGGVSYFWNNGQYDASISVTTPGTYTVTATGANGCEATAQLTVTMNPLPIATVTESVEICQGQQAQLSTDAPAGCTYTWSTGSHQSRIFTSEAGEYQVTVTNANQCSRVYQSYVIVHELPVINIIGEAEICQGQSTTLTVNGDAVAQYNWSSGDQNANITVSTQGLYSVTATNSYGCTATASRSVVVHPLPVATISGTLAVCKDASTTLTATGGVSYLWSTGSTASSISVSPTESQSYSVTVSDAYGCESNTSASVTVNALPLIRFSGLTTICAGTSTNVTASGANTYVWSTGGQNATVSLNQAGMYYVTATNNHQCVNTDSIQITVNPNPDVQISGDDYVCLGSTMSLTASGAQSYQWNTEEVSATIAVSPAANTTYSVTGYDANGCQSTASKVVSVKSLPVVTVSGSQTICAGKFAILTASGGSSYLWSTGKVGNTLTVSPSGNQTYVVTATNDFGCSASLDVPITVNPLPTVNFLGNTTICSGATTSITAEGGNSYNWSTGGHNATINISNAGMYYVTVTNSQNCSRTDSVYVTVNPNPSLQIEGPSYICLGDVTSLTVSGAQTYVWNTEEMSATINVAPSVTTTYTVTGYDTNGCQSTNAKVVNVEALPTISVSGNKTICIGQSTTLTATGGVNFQWSNGVTGNSIVVSPTSTQSYVVTVTNSLGCSSSLETTVTVNSLPNITFNGTTEICDGATATITASGGVSYQWSNGSHSASASITEEGYYRVTATNAQNCVNLDSVFVKVNPNPVVQISGSNYVCAGGITTLTASGAQTYLWNTEEVSPSISVTPSAATTYTVTGYDQNGCSMTVSKVVNVEALPNIQVLGTRTICAGQSASLTATGGSVYLWNTGDTISDIVVTPMTSQSYVVTVTNAYGCLASSAVTVTVNALPQIHFNGNTTICAGNTTTISAIGASSYSWSTGAQTGNLNVSSTGMYYVTATNAQNCSKTDSIYVTVNPNPVVQILGNNHLCFGSIATLTATGASTYSWNTGENTAEISIAPESNTTYSVTGYDTNGCFATVQKVVNVESLPEVQILGNRTICQGQSTVLTAMGGNTYLWSNGSNTQNIAIFPNVSTTYTVTAYNAFGCSTVESVLITVNVLPSIVFNGSTSICQGESTTITATGGNTYLWSTGANTNNITVSTPGMYKVSVTNSLNCTRMDSVNVVVWDNPVVSINGNSLICQGSVASLTASGAETYLWNTGESSAAITVMPEQTTTYNVIGYDEHGCSSTVSKVVNVEALPQVFISGELAICHGTSTTLTASDAYSYVWSTGSTANSITVSNQGAYTVTVTSENGCQSIASATVVDNPFPTFTLNGPDDICENTTETLSVTGDYTYLWSTGETTTDITITSGGVYTVTATNDYDCSATASVNVNLLPAPELTIMGVSTLCQGDTTVLTASSDAVEYVWNTGDSTQSIVVIPDNSLYTVTATGANGCTSTTQHLITTLPVYDITVNGAICEHQGFNNYGFDIPVIDTAGTYTFVQNLQTVTGCDSTITLLLTVQPLPRLDTINGPQNITQYGNVYYSINNPQYANSYEWLISNTHWTIDYSYNNATLNVNNNNGTGILTARGINNCGYTEITLNLYCNVGIEDYPANAVVTLYPNPVQQSLYINTENAPDISKVRLYNEAGRLVYQTDCNDTHFEIDCTRFANGHYTVQFLNEKGRRVESRKIVVKNN